jgi:hypothetical protein
MDLNQVNKILKAFPLATDESPEGHPFDAYHFIPVDNSNKFHCVRAPYFLRDATEFKVNSTGINEYGTTPENAQLLVNTLVFDGKIFGCWLQKPNKKIVWIGEHSAEITSRIAEKERALFFSLFIKHINAFKTYLLLLGIDISPRDNHDG